MDSAAMTTGLDVPPDASGGATTSALGRRGSSALATATESVTTPPTQPRPARPLDANDNHHSSASLIYEHNDQSPKSSFQPPGRKGSLSSRHTDVDPLDKIPYDMPGGFPVGDDDYRSNFDGPSSAPAVPTVVSVTHPPAFIHTHHPRRGSLTPLGLNVISPVLPLQVQRSLETASMLSSSPTRSVGFTTPAGEYVMDHGRRDSVATVASSASRTSASSNLTATRPTYQSSLGSGQRRSSLTPSLPNLALGNNSHPTIIPSSFNPFNRRSSLTPSMPTLAAPSPTRAHVTGRLEPARSTTGEGPTHSRTMDVVPGDRRGSAAVRLADSRRGSLPHLYYGAWTGPGQPSPRAMAEPEPAINRGFTFGTISSEPPALTASDPGHGGSAAQSLQRIAQISSASRRAEDSSSAFQAAEEAEAERQRRAFLAATYGEDSARARARLSLGGGSSNSPSSTASTRRQSLLVWERVNKKPDGTAAAAGPSTSSSHVPPIFNAAMHDDQLAASRRPSLPINIGKTPPARAAETFDDPNIWDHPDDLSDGTETPMRPLPPLMPLSDPVPRLLPSTLALHRASHLLSSRNLESEPLPSPLPTSLHPPQPVDLSEFDIDFILAGSKSNLGRTGSGRSKHLSAGSGTAEGPSGSRPGGLEEEDSFAKFVGAFDDEYGDRRGDWTFRACKQRNQTYGSDPSDPSRPVPRTEWDSPGAGKFEVYPNGDVRSVESGCVWRIKRTSLREYELEQPMPGLAKVHPPEPLNPNAPQPVIILPCGGYTLTSKSVHTESGGVKLPLHVQRDYSARGSRVSRRFAAARNRQSISEASRGDWTEGQERRDRLGSHDSAATALPISQRQSFALSSQHSSLPSSHTSQISGSQISQSLQSTVSPTSVSPPKEDRSARSSRSRIEEERKKGLGGVLKRGLFKASNLLEERKDKNHHRSPNGLNGKQRPQQHSQQPALRPTHSDRSDAASASSKHSSSKYTSDSADDADMWDDAQFGSLGLGIEDEQNGGLPWKEGTAWEGVPEDALAMVIPIESDSLTPPIPTSATRAFINPFFVDGPKQALLVWFTPFDAGISSMDRRPSALFKIHESPAHELWESNQNHSSLGRLPKLLRPRGKSELPNRGLSDAKHIAVPPPTTPPSDSDEPPRRSESHNAQRLPFTAFRVVAKVVDVENLRSVPEIPVIPLEQWTEQMRTGKPVGVTTPPLDSASIDEPRTSLDNVMSGRAFPTVIAVCHSQTSGVEFVLEGLDRLGLCKGESAWGPTGYEEWRGTGLSDTGRQMLDLLWAACSAVMGI